MKAKIKKLLVDALRSEEYKQTFGTYENPSGCVCILGVLRDIFRKETNDTEDKNRLSIWYEVNSWSGYNSFNSQLTINGITEAWTTHNDEYGVTFKEFADAIEEQL